MEHLCWNCGSAFHHRQTCDQPPNPDLRREIQKAHKKGPGKNAHARRNATQFEKMIQKQSWRLQKDSSPPIKMLDIEIGRLSQFLSDRRSNLDDLKGPVSADCLESKLVSAVELESLFGTESENIRFATSMDRSYDLQEDDLLKLKMDTLQSCHQVLKDDIFNLRSRLYSALSVIQEVTKTENILHEFVLQGMEAYSERPLEIATIKRKWDDMKHLRKSTQTVVKKFNYLFSTDDQDMLSTKMKALEKGWTDLKETRKSYESDLDKTICKVCLENEVKCGIIPCGHAYCDSCFQNLITSTNPTCGHCRGNVKGKLTLFF